MESTQDQRKLVRTMVSGSQCFHDKHLSYNLMAGADQGSIK